jgi:hypothetical protein
LTTNIRGYLVHRIKVLREAIFREETSSKPDRSLIVSLLNRKNELENVLKECRT